MFLLVYASLITATYAYKILSFKLLCYLEDDKKLTTYEIIKEWVQSKWEADIMYVTHSNT